MSRGSTLRGTSSQSHLRTSNCHAGCAPPLRRFSTPPMSSMRWGASHGSTKSLNLRRFAKWQGG
eukprot:1861858-Prymnesium_polylepis.1